MQQRHAIIQRLLRDQKGFWFASAKAKVQEKIDAELAACYGLEILIGQAGMTNRVLGNLQNGLGDMKDANLGQKLLQAVQHAIDTGKFTGDMLDRANEFVASMTDPAAMAQMVGMMTAGFAIKKGLCGKPGAQGVVGGVLFAGEMAALITRLGSLANTLNSATFTSEVNESSADVAKEVNELLLNHAFIEWMTKFACFPAGTQVIVVDQHGERSSKPIEQIRVGDLVLARDEHGTEIGPRPVINVMQRQVWQKYVVAYTAVDGTRHTLDTTSEHPFWVTNRNEWVAAKELAAGDLLVGPKGQAWQVESVAAEVLSEGLTVYNFTVDQAHTYYVAPQDSPTAFVLVHNACKHHMIPREIYNPRSGGPGWLPPHLAGDVRIRGSRGTPNRWTLPDDVHQHIHSNAGGNWNKRWKEELIELEKTKDPSTWTAEDILYIRDKLAKQFELLQYKP